MASSRISGITIEIGGDTSKLSTALKDVNSEIKNTSTQLKDVEKLLKLDPTNTELLAQKQRLLADEISATSEKLGTLQTAAEQANDALANGDITQEQYDALQREIIDTEEKLASLTAQAEEFGDTASLSVADVGQAMQDVGSKVEDLGSKLTGVSAVASGALAGGVTSAVQMDKAYDTIIKKTGETGETLTELTGIADNIFAEMPTTAEAAGTAVGEVNTRFNLLGDDLQNVSEDFIRFAQINDTDLNSSIDNVDKIMTKFGIDTDDVGSVLGLLTDVGQRTGLSMESLESTLSSNGATLKSFGFSLTESANLLAMMEQNGVDTSTAMTGLRKAITNAAEEGLTADEALEQMIDTIRDADDEVEALNYATELFGSRGAIEMTDAIREGRFSIDDLNGSIEDYATTVEDTYNATISPWDELKVAMNNLELAGSELGSAFLEVLQPAIDWVVDAAQKLADWFTNLDEDTQQLIATVGGIVAALAPVLTIGGKLIEHVGSFLTDLPSLSEAIGGVQEAFSLLLSPVGAVLGVIAALIAAFTTLWNTNEDFKNSIIEIWENIKSTVGDFIQGVIDRLNDLGFSFDDLGDIVDAIKQVWIDFCNVIAPLFEGAFQTVSDTISFVTDAILGILDVFIGLFTGDWDQFWTGISELVTNIWDGICNFIDNIGSTIWGIIGNILGLINSDWEETWNNIGDFISGIWEDIKTFVSEGLENILSNIGEKIGNIVTTITDGLNEAKDFVLGLIDQALQWGSDLIGNIAEGIKGAISKVTDAVTGVADKIKSFLHFSVPDEGPLTDIASWMPDMVQTLADGINQGTQTVSTACTQMASAAMTALESGLNQSLSIATNFTNSMNSLFTSWANSIQSLISSMSNTLVQTFTTLFNTLTTNFNSFLSSTESTLTSKINSWTQAIQTFLQNIEQSVKQSLTSIQTSTESTLQAFDNLITQFLNSTSENILTVTQTTFETVDQMITQYMTSIAANIQTMITQAVEAYTSVVNTLGTVTETGFKPATDYIESLVPKFKQWGIDMMDNLINGIKSKEAALERELEKLADEISDYMEFSVPKKGPLSDADTWMPDMMKLFAQGIESYSSLVTDQLKGLTTDMSLMTQSGNNNKQTINLNSQSVLLLDGKQIAQSVDNYLGVAFG